MKGLEALEHINKNIIVSQEDIDEDINIIEKELKALEILKSKLSPLAKTTFLPMTQEEYELVTEVLLCH